MNLESALGIFAAWEDSGSLLYATIVEGEKVQAVSGFIGEVRHDEAIFIPLAETKVVLGVRAATDFTYADAPEDAGPEKPGQSIVRSLEVIWPGGSRIRFVELKDDSDDVL